MTLNGVAVILRYFTEFRSFGGQLAYVETMIKIEKCRPMSLSLAFGSVCAMVYVCIIYAIFSEVTEKECVKISAFDTRQQKNSNCATLAALPSQQ